MTIAIISPGDMGQAIGSLLARGGERVVTCLAGRSERTRALAGAAGFVDLPSLDALVRESELMRSSSRSARRRRPSLSRRRARLWAVSRRTRSVSTTSPSRVAARGSRIARVATGSAISEAWAERGWTEPD